MYPRRGASKFTLQCDSQLITPQSSTPGCACQVST